MCTVANGLFGYQCTPVVNRQILICSITDLKIYANLIGTNIKVSYTDQIKCPLEISSHPDAIPQAVYQKKSVYHISNGDVSPSSL